MRHCGNVNSAGAMPTSLILENRHASRESAATVSKPIANCICRREGGYTLAEIMVVLGIIAVLVSSAIYILVGDLGVA